MLWTIYLFWFLAGGVWIARCLLPALRPLTRGYIGLSLGVLLCMWLPALTAMGMRFTLAAHGVSAAELAALCALAWLLRDKRSPAAFDENEKRVLTTLLWLVVPLTLLSGYLQYTHDIRLAGDGTYHVGQSTYGDLSLHLAVTTSAVNASFPLQNSLMLGATMAYPYLADTFATSLYMMGLPLNAAMAVTGTLMMALVYTGYALLCARLCKTRGAMTLAVLLLFLNGGLGFFYTLSGSVDGGVRTTIWDNLENVLFGYYQTPTNQPDPNNLRWSNILCDMLIPQRGILGGWTLLMPCLNLLIPPFAKGETPSGRQLVLLGLFAGGLPLVHTHSFLALFLFSAGLCAYVVLTAPRGGRMKAFGPFLLYGGVTAALALPQLVLFTFQQAAQSNHFLAFQFNWINNRGGDGLVDPYLWFYIKNIGLPFLLIVFALFEKNRAWRMVASGAFLIFVVAELFRFQPNDYDNNKLFYVWFLLCLPMAADYAVSLYRRLKGLRAKPLIAALFLIACFLSAGLTVARECIGDYEAYSRDDLATADFVRERTPEHCVFITGNQHLNPVSSLAGRTILCSSELYLYYHGFDTTRRREEVAAFYQNPLENEWVLRRYGVSYIYVSDYERLYADYETDEAAIARLYTLVYESPSGTARIYQVDADG